MPASVAIADLNGDGKADLAVSNWNNNTVGILLNIGWATNMSAGSSPNPAAVNRSIILTATVTSGTGVPTGNVSFSQGSTMLGTGTLGISGKATINTSFAAVGHYSVVASYRGDNTFAPNSSSYTQQVNKAGTKTSLTSSLNPALVGQSILFTATVVPAYGGTPTGSVSFILAGTVVATVPIVNSQATFTTSFSATGSYKINVKYNGDADFQASTSVYLYQKVNGYPTVASLASSVNPSNYGQDVTFTATVTSPYGAPTGTVTFKRGTTVLGTVALSGSTATLSTSALNAGTNYIKAFYNGDTNFATSTSPQLAQVVKGITSTTTLTSSSNPSALGQTVTFTATVSAAVGTPVGNVTFKRGITALGTVALSGGVATFSTSTLPAGSNLITARYGGSTNYQPSTSAILTQAVQ
jgi:hypothetical protein